MNNLVQAFLMFAAVYLAGFLPVQRLRSRRASIIGGLLGAGLVLLGIVLLSVVTVDLNSLERLVLIMGLMLIGVAMLLGSATRFYILGRSDLAPAARWQVTALVGAALAVLEFALLRFAGSLLD